MQAGTDSFSLLSVFHYANITTIYRFLLSLFIADVDENVFSCGIWDI